MKELEPHDLTVIQAIEALRGGRLTSCELVESCLTRIVALEPVLHAWVHLEEELPRRAAAAVDEKRSSQGEVGDFQGVPFGIKDIFNTKDMPTQMGSPIWEGFTPGNDARVVEQLRWGDAIPMGKTVTAEFAVRHPGPTVNPYDVARSPGTSSSGSAVAVAAGMVPFALGTQTAGSTIRPASYCGVFGFKPSFGVVPRTGILKTIDTLDHVTCLARSPADLRLVFDQVRVSGRNHPMLVGTVDRYAQGCPAPAPWRVGLVRGPRWGDAEPYARTALEDLAARLDAMALATVTELELPALFSEVHATHEQIYAQMLAYYFAEECEQRELVSDWFLEMVESGKRFTPEDYRAGLEVQREARQLLDSLFERYDIVLNLSTGGEALVGNDTQDRPDNCLIWTFCGVPSLSVPAFVGPSGLPFGAQLVARRYQDYRLLDFACQLVDAGVIARAPYPLLHEHGGAGLLRPETRRV